MRKLIPTIVVACAAAFTLGGCDKGDTPTQASDTAAAPAAVAAKPANPSDKDAWKKYLVSVVTANMDGVKSNHPYMYFIPGGDDDTAKSDRSNQLENVKTAVSRGVLAGNMMAFGGPDSKLTAQFMTDAFAGAGAGSFKDVRVLFIGDSAEADGVKQAMAPNGADLRFVEAK